MQRNSNQLKSHKKNTSIELQSLNWNLFTRLENNFKFFWYANTYFFNEKCLEIWEYSLFHFNSIIFFQLLIALVSFHIIKATSNKILLFIFSEIFHFHFPHTWSSFDSAPVNLLNFVRQKCNVRLAHCSIKKRPFRLAVGLKLFVVMHCTDLVSAPSAIDLCVCVCVSGKVAKQ